MVQIITSLSSILSYLTWREGVFMMVLQCCVCLWIRALVLVGPHVSARLFLWVHVFASVGPRRTPPSITAHAISSLLVAHIPFCYLLYLWLSIWSHLLYITRDGPLDKNFHLLFSLNVGISLPLLMSGLRVLTRPLPLFRCTWALWFFCSWT